MANIEDPNDAADYAYRIMTARDVLEIYMNKTLPYIPQAIATSDERHRVYCHLNCVKEWYDEVLTQIEEIRVARAGYQAEKQTLNGADKAAFSAAYKNLIDANELQNFLRAANQRLNALRDLKTTIHNVLKDGVGGSAVKSLALPKLQIQKFYGDNWEEFWPLFESSIHNDTELDQVQKMSYLDSLLSGEAKKAIQGLIPFSGPNYVLAVDILKDKYGKDDNLIRDLHNKLFRLSPAKNLNEDFNLQLETEKLCRLLVHHHQDLSSPQIYLNLEQKLSKKTLQRYLDIKSLKMTAEPDRIWTTALFRETFKSALDQLKQFKDIYTRGNERTEKSKDGKRRIKEEPDSTLNMAVRYRDPPQGGRSPTFRNRSDRKLSGNSSRSSSYSSNTSNEPSRSLSKRRGSPWPANQNDRRPRDRRQWSSDSSRNSSPKGSRSPSRFPCPFCKGVHFALDCDRYKTVDERRKQIESTKLCYTCLREGHMAKDCRRYNRKCFLCRKPRHHPALCQRRKPTFPQSTPKTEHSVTIISEPESSGTEISTAVYRSCLKNPKSVRTLLKCAKVTIYNPRNPKRRKRIVAFLDDGSEKTYMSKTLIEELKLDKVDEVSYEVKGLGGVKIGSYQSSVVEFGLKGKAINMIMRARELKKVMPKLPYIKVQQVNLEKLMTTKIKVSLNHEEPSMLIGSDFYNYLAIQPEEQLANGFWISNSKLGKILSGEGKIESNGKSTTDETATTLISASVDEHEDGFGILFNGLQEFSDSELNKMVDRHQRLETVGLGDAANNHDDELKDFEEKLSFNGERYEVKLSWNEEVEQLPDNYYLAQGRLRSTKKKLDQRPELLKQYHEIILDQLQKGIIERVPEQQMWKKLNLNRYDENHLDETTKSELEQDEKVHVTNSDGKVESKSGKSAKTRKRKKRIIHYLPHHFVERIDKLFTKIRIVFDASSKVRKSVPSLNQCLRKGPKLYNDLIGIILRARLKPYLMTCDVEKAFLQISIAPEDRDALRFLWYENPEDQNSELVEYRFCRVTFGVICSPAHLSIVTKHHFQKYDSEIIRQIESDTYVDNILVGLNGTSNVWSTYEFLKGVFKDANMNVREFTSNAWEQIRQIPQCDRIDDEWTKLLGLHWNVKKDTLAIKLAPFPKDKPVTRRTILSQIAKPFDPLGIISPIILKGKVIRQKLEKDKTLKWDSQAPEDIKNEWLKYMESWNNQSIEVPRRYGNYSNRKNLKFELHGFSDASEYGMGCAIYLRIIEENGDIHSELVFAKSLVVPSQTAKAKRSIPKLELHAAKICSDNLYFVKKELEKEIHINGMRLWTDSTDVVDFLNSQKEKDRFVNNRIKAIRKKNLKVSHVPGKENPADYASRGMTPAELNGNQSWFKGPVWLREKEMKWQKPIKEFDPNAFVLDSKEPLIEMSSATTSKSFESLSNYGNFSQFKRLKHATAYFLRSIDTFKNLQKDRLKIHQPELDWTTGQPLKESQRIKNLIAKIPSLSYI